MKHLFLIAFIFTCQFLLGQEVIINDMISKSAIQDVTVSLKGDNKKLFSNKNGSVDLSSFKYNDTLFIQHIGYEPMIIIKKELSDLVNLIPINYLLETLVLSTPKDEIVSRNSIQELTRDNINTIQKKQTTTLLKKGMGVFIQESQSGGGSPNVRGMEANRLLVVVDGISLNNTISRGGHLQNLSTISPQLIESARIVFGPAAVAFGSGAMAGAITLHTINPSFSLGTKHFFSQQFESSTGSSLSHYHVNYQNNKIAFLSSFNVQAAGNLRMGKIRRHGYENWGNESHIIKNGRQLKTDYHQASVMQKILLKVNQNTTLLSNTQFSRIGIVNRFDKLNDLSEGLGKYKSWYYGPQSRFMHNLQLKSLSPLIIMDKYAFTLTFQRLKESRHKQKSEAIYLSNRWEKIDIYDVKIDLKKKIEAADLNYGFSSKLQNVNSKANLTSSSGNSFYQTSRYPDGGSKVLDVSFYTQMYTPINKKLDFYFGGRFNYNDLKAKFMDTVVIRLPFSTIRTRNTSFAGSFKTSYKIGNFLKLSGLIYTGFRNPNIDDIGKIFSKNDQSVVLPNYSLEPEKTINFEYRILAKKSDIYNFSFAIFESHIKNVIVRENSKLNNLDSIFYDGTLMQIQMNQNLSSAKIRGIDFQLNIKLNSFFFFNGICQHVSGNTREKIPLSHIPPFNANGSIDYKKRNTTLSCYVFYNGWKHASEFDLAGIDNFDEATIEGSPSWYTLNCSYSKKIDDQMWFKISLENILDTHYKVFASGISSSGRNLIVSLDSYF